MASEFIHRNIVYRSTRCTTWTVNRARAAAMRATLRRTKTERKKINVRYDFGTENSFT
ncbi:unnamed protein product, partial [Trichogramma brassicae]